MPEFKKACLPTPEQINYDIHTAAMNLAAGDTYNFKRMPADRAASAYDRAIKKLTEDLQHEMISDPSRFDSKKQLGVDNGKIQ